MGLGLPEVAATLSLLALMVREIAFPRMIPCSASHSNAAWVPEITPLLVHAVIRAPVLETVAWNLYSLTSSRLYEDQSAAAHVDERV